MKRPIREVEHFRIPYDGVKLRNFIFKLLVESKFSVQQPVETLEAGCGRKWALKDTLVQFVIDGVDLDKTAAEIRMRESCDLRTFYHQSLTDFCKPQTYDFVYCVDVLEHCENSQQVVSNLLRSLKPGGVSLFAFPNPNSFFGFWTKFTPHFVHVLVYKYLYKVENAGMPGFAPYPVLYEDSIREVNFEELVRQQGGHIEYKLVRDVDHRRFGLFSSLVRVAQHVWGAVFPAYGRPAGLIYWISMPD